MGVTEGLANIDQIKSTLQKIEARVSNAKGLSQQQSRIRKEHEPMKDTFTNPYKIPKAGVTIHLGDWLGRHIDDPATKVSRRSC